MLPKEQPRTVKVYGDDSPMFRKLLEQKLVTEVGKNIYLCERWIASIHNLKLAPNE